MVVWQFTTIAVLIGALLIYVMVLTNRLGTTNALLKRIEEGLVRPQPVTENLPDRAAEVVPARPLVPMERTAMEHTAVMAPVAAPARAAEMDVEEAPAAEVSERDRRVSYLTVRDLKVIARSGRRSSDTPAGVSPLFNEVFGRKHGRIEVGAESPAEQSSEAQEEHAAPHLEVVAVDEPMVASIESAAAFEELAVATYEIQDFLETTPSPDAAVTEDETAAFEPTTTDPAPVEPVAAMEAPVIPEPAPAAPMATVFSEPATSPHIAAVDSESTTESHIAAVVAEPATSPHIAAVVAEPALESHFTAEVAEPAVVPHPTAPLSEQPAVSHLQAAVHAVEPSTPPPAKPPEIVAANEDQPPAAAPAAAAAESEPGDAAAREEKRKRDLMMHAYRRRRSR
jgi:hypothetical protein